MSLGYIIYYRGLNTNENRQHRNISHCNELRGHLAGIRTATSSIAKYHTQILNYDPVTISANYRCFKHPHGTPKEKISQFLNDIMRCPKDFRRNQRFRDFRKQFLHETTHFVTSQEVDSHYPRADVYITGSDQIWNPIITKGLDPIYTLNFGKNDFKKISYAASTGNNNAIKNDINMLVGQLQNFDAISVREKQLQQLLSTKDINDVTLTLDPSLLLTKNEWQKIIPNDYRPNRKYILAYSWEESEDFFRAINQLAQQMGCMIYYYRRHELLKTSFIAPKNPTSTSAHKSSLRLFKMPNAFLQPVFTERHFQLS